MANATVTYTGADNEVVSTLDEQRALFLKLFSGEVLSAFEEGTLFLDKHQTRTITAGKSSQFPVIGRIADAEYHTPGEEILGQDIPLSERTITVDKLLLSHLFMSDIDEAMSHFETRSRFARSMSQKLSQTFDNHIARELILAAQASSVITGDTTMDGTVYTDADLESTTDATKLTAWIDMFYSFAETFDNKYVTTGTRFAVVKPADYYFLAKAVNENGFSAIHRDYGGEGSFAKGEITEIAGIRILPFTGLPTTDYSSEDFHAVNATNTKAICFTDEAVGTVKLLDLSLQSEWDIRRQGTLMVARYAMGHGILRPECSIHARTAAPA